jgi:hypothetical protein
MPDRFTGSRRVIDGIPSSSVPGDEYYSGGFYQMRGPHNLGVSSLSASYRYTEVDIPRHTLQALSCRPS